MRRLWMRWIALVVFVAVLGGVFIVLGEWQLSRLNERKERNAVVVANQQRPVRPYAEVFAAGVSEDEQWQRVEASGRFDPDHQFVIRYRSNGDVRGYEVVTPLQTAAGWVLVDRGFVPRDRSEAIPTVAPPPPAGEVRIVGHVRRSERGKAGAVQPVDGQARLVSSAGLGSALPYPVADGYLSLLSVEPPQTPELEPVLPPDISEGPHFWYAVQWFMFAALGVLGIVVFIRADLRDRRQGGAARRTAMSGTGAVKGSPSWTSD